MGWSVFTFGVRDGSSNASIWSSNSRFLAAFWDESINPSFSARICLKSSAQPLFPMNERNFHAPKPYPCKCPCLSLPPHRSLCACSLNSNRCLPCMERRCSWRERRIARGSLTGQHLADELWWVAESEYMLLLEAHPTHELLECPHPQADLAYPGKSGPLCRTERCAFTIKCLDQISPRAMRGCQRPISTLEAHSCKGRLYFQRPPPLFCLSENIFIARLTILSSLLFPHLAVNSAHSQLAKKPTRIG